MHCLACDDLLALPEDRDGEIRCRCGRSSAERDPRGTPQRPHGTVSIHGPCRVVWFDRQRMATTVLGSPHLPPAAPVVIRKPVPPLL